MTATVLCPACGQTLVEADPVADGERRCGCGAVYVQADGILDLSGPGEAPTGYDPHYFDTLPAVEETHFWYLHRREVIRSVLGRHLRDLASKPLFDVGCGSGGLLAWLAASGIPVSGGCDAYPQGLRLARRRLAVRYLQVGGSGPPPLAPGVALLGFFDVLEHLDDDDATLAWAWSVLEGGGHLILTVPAHPFLFDEMDELARHRRRYTRADLHGKLRRAGFEVVVVRYFMALLVPLLLAARLGGRLLPGRFGEAGRRRDAELRVQPGLNGLLRGSLRVEEAMARVVPLPFGSSLVALARRPLPSQASGTERSPS